ncbi:MAG: 3-hydroxyacyl-CoA dehydrogenase NAD-binding domain-containing protein [Candidatus Methanomethylicia archaeon]
MVRDIKTISCIGAGTIGHSWALLFSKSGFNVNLYDVDSDVLKRALQNIEYNLQTLSEAGIVDRDCIEGIMGRIKVYTDLAKSVRDADYIQESAPENLDLKKKLFIEISKNCPVHAIIASSSSTLPISKIAEGLEDPSRCIVVHPINPPHIIPLVELIPSPKTLSEVTQTVYNLCLRIGMMPIIVRKEVPGYVVNRLQFSILREAIDLVLKGVVSVEDIDKAISYGLGLRWALMGPFLVFHLTSVPGGIAATLSKYREAFEYVFRDLATWTEIPSEAYKALPEGLKMEIGSRDQYELIKWRDRKILEILKIKKS